MKTAAHGSELIEAIVATDLPESAAVPGVSKQSATLFKGSEFRSCVKVEVAVLGSRSQIVRTFSVDVKQHWNIENRPNGLCGRMATLTHRKSS